MNTLLHKISHMSPECLAMVQTVVFITQTLVLAWAAILIRRYTKI